MPRRLPPARISLAIWLALLPTTWAQSPATDPAASAKPTFEEWTLIILDGKRCGFGSTITTQVDTPSGKGFRTDLQEEFVVKRLGISLKMNEVSHITEDVDGVVLAFDQVQSGMGSNIEMTGKREGDDLVVTSRGQTQRYHIPRPAALGPEAIRRLTDAVPLKAGTTFTLNTFTTDYPQAVAVQKGSIVGEEDHVVQGVTRKLWKMTSTTPIMPGVTTVWVDESNNDVETDVNIPGFGDLQEIVADHAECMKQPEGAEIFAGSLIAPQRALTHLRQQAQATYRLTTSDSKLELELWNHGEQRVRKSEAGLAEIEVTVPIWTAGDAAYSLPHADTSELRSFLQPSAYLESGSPEIQRLAKQAIGSEKNPVLAARMIEKFVEGFITKKDLNVGFASAQETAQTREGDCTEHAVLCAALGRAVGLPTRCVLGLGYIPPGTVSPTISNSTSADTGIFGFHMWAEALVGPDKWVAMDAALGGFDIGHIAIVKTALADINPMIDLNMPILTLMEDLHITVLRTVSREQFAQPAPLPSREKVVPPTSVSAPPTSPTLVPPSSKID